ncbi:MAG TPA: SDR family NAD(P)-dependent oxidoreductase [Candidatus Dormibacteraeota bacterium]|nr:SDR family NAD(P)-dependent oxidoreductase [Candidatus Dormibacteraeota bacterium]
MSADLAGKVAVVTGAASGIGYALAQKWVSQGMKVVLADVEEDALEKAADELGELGKVMAVPTDVSRSESVEELRRQAEAFGQVRVVCNNAGVGGVTGGPAWEKPLAEWQWVLGVNLWGVINGVRAFMPGMVRRDEGNIVNTASAAGLLPFAFASPYAASKHAVVGISLSMYQELANLGSRVHVSVLCPGPIRTRIADSTRNWLDHLGTLPEANSSDMSQMLAKMMRSIIEAGIEPAEAAQQVFSAVEEDRFWVLPNADSLFPAIKEVVASAVEGRTPPILSPT